MGSMVDADRRVAMRHVHTAGELSRLVLREVNTVIEMTRGHQREDAMGVADSLAGICLKLEDLSLSLLCDS